MVYSKCLCCGSTSRQDKELSFHAFPSDGARRSLWLTACGLTENVCKPSSRLCSKHFDQDCFRAVGTPFKFLKPNSVPTKFNKNDKEFFISSSHEMLEMSSCEVSELHTDQIDVHDVSTAKFETILDFIVDPSQIYSTPKQKSRKYNAGDVTTPNLATPTRAKQSCVKVRNKVIEQRKKIKHLKLKVYKLRRRLSYLTGLVNDLKKKNLPTEQAHSIVLIHMVH